MTATIQTIGGELYADSRDVAQVLGVYHKNFREMLTDRIEHLGHVRFETAEGTKLPQGGVAPGERYMILTERQALIALTLVRNTPQAVAAKVALVDAFQDMRKKLAEASRPSMAGQVKAPRELSGALIAQLIKTYGQKEAGHRIDFLIGYIERRPSVIKFYERQATEKQIRELEEFVANLGNKAATAVSDAIQNGVGQIAKKITAGEFDFGGAS